MSIQFLRKVIKTMKSVNFKNVKITGGFWKEKQSLVKNTTVKAVYDRFSDTYRFDAFKCDWKDGDAPEKKPHIFWDSDVAKWIEGVSYTLYENRDEKLEKIIDNVVDLIAKNRDENGYFNSYYLTVAPEKKFTIRDNHELYCAGHLMEAAIAYYESTGKDKFLKVMCKYADYIDKVFRIEKSAAYFTPGHPEIELALIRLYDATSEERYLKLAEYFIDEHGKHIKLLPKNRTLSYNQDEIPLTDITEAKGHCVRALYLYCGMIDVARKRNDEKLYRACERVFENIINKKMYITGGVGSSRHEEAFTINYDLPNRKAYAESCAAIGLCMFALRMQKTYISSKYADTIERVIYNGFLSSMSMDGKKFFYENPLAVDPVFNHTVKDEIYSITERVEVFSCSCCPPNIVRFIPSIGDYLYSCNDEAVFVHQFMESDAEFDGISIRQKTNYPIDGNIHINCDTKGKKLAIRIPYWVKKFKINKEYTLKDGYAYIEDAKDEISVTFDLSVNIIRSNPKVHENAGRIAVMRGPVVYCAEGVDNGENIFDIMIDTKSKFSEEKSEFMLPSLVCTAYEPLNTDELYPTDSDNLKKRSLKLIPYYAFANRGTSEMAVWILKK